MLTYKDLYEKDTWAVSEIRKHIGYSKKVIVLAGTLLRDKMISIDNPLNWGLDIDLLCEVYSTIIQVFNHFDMITGAKYEKDRDIKVSDNAQIILKAYSENIELCQMELQKEYFLYLSPHAISFN